MSFNRKKKQAVSSTETRIVCPHCGKDIYVPEHEHVVNGGIAIGKDSNLGTIVLPPADGSSILRRLKTRGFDITGMVPIFDDKTGKETGVVKITANGVETVHFDDPTAQKIIEAGNIFNPELFKQHVMGQMLRFLTTDSDYEASIFDFDEKKKTYRLSHFNNRLKRMTYDYTWQVLEDMLYRQHCMLFHGDTKTFEFDNLWYNRDLAVFMALDYTYQLSKEFDSCRVRKCRGRKYVKVHDAGRVLGGGRYYKGIFLDDREKFFDVFAKITEEIRDAKDATDLWFAVKEFNRIRPKGLCFKKHHGWIDAYKGYGAYWTMQNLILFHNCFYIDNECGISTGEKAMEHLNKDANFHCEHGEGWCLLGRLKEVLRRNQFDIDGTRRSWKERRNKK